MHVYISCCGQIVMKNGDPIGYGIIEYKHALDAEKSQRSLNGYQVENIPLRVTYCIPGQSAMDICTRIVKKHVCEYFRVSVLL